MRAQLQTQAGATCGWEVKGSGDRAGGLGLCWAMEQLTFSLSHDRKGTFAIFGRGHLRIRGGGARGLSCSSHVRVVT